MGRAPCCDKANVKRGPWSPEEDATLRSYLEKHGTGGNWIALPQKAGLNRCGKSCRLRWLNYLRPDIKHGNFTDEEDNIICALYQSIGSRWSVIASHLPGRTDNDVKNYWNTKLKKRLMAGGGKLCPPPPTPPPPPPSLPAYFPKTEPSYNYTDHLISSSVFYSELPPFPTYKASTNAYNFSPSDDISGASSSVTVENSAAVAGGDYYNPWETTNGTLVGEYLASELSFSSYSDFLNMCGSMDKNIGEDGSQLHCSTSSFWNSIPADSKPQGLTYS